MNEVSEHRQNDPAKTERRIRDLERYVENNSSLILESSREFKNARNNRDRVNVLLKWLLISKAARNFVDKTIVWRLGIVIIATVLLSGGAFAIFSSLATGIIFAALSISATWALMFYPSDRELTEVIGKNVILLEQLQLRVQSVGVKMNQAHESVDELNAELEQLRRRLNAEQLRASDEFKRRQLLSERWKEYRAEDFEHFLARVFTELGYEVETTKIVGDQGVDLIIKKSGKRIAIQAKGYLHSVSNAAVQQVNTGKDYYGCHASVVITNSRFTASAIDVAAKVHCILISETELPHLIMGHLNLLSKCFEFEDN